MPDNLDWASPSGSYKRIRIAEWTEIEFTYPLIATYVQEPSLALSIDEIVVDPAWQQTPWGCSLYNYMSDDVEVGEPPVSVSQESHAAIENYVRGLGLGNATTVAMIEALRWKRVNRLGSRQSAPQVHDFRKHNGEYAGTATVILFSLARHIRVLHMGDLEVYGGRDIIQDYLLHNNHRLLSKPALQEVETVHHITHPSGTETSHMYDDLDFLTYLRCFPRLPALHTVTMEALREYQRVAREFYPPRTACFKNLSITHVDISSNMLAAIIRLPRALESLTVSTGGRGDGTSVVWYKTVGKALREHRETLRMLHLSLGESGRFVGPESEEYPEEVYDDDYAEDEFGVLPPKDDDEYLGMYQRSLMDSWYHLDLANSTGPRWPHQLPDGDYGLFGEGIGSLRGFTALRSLSIDPRALLGWSRPVRIEDPVKGAYNKFVLDPPFQLIDALPPGLEVLRLYDYEAGQEEEVDRHVDELMRLKMDKLPNLQVVEGVEEVIEKISRRSSKSWKEQPWIRPGREMHWVRDEL